MLYLPALSVCAVASLSRRNCKQKMTFTIVNGTDQQCIKKNVTQGLILRLVLCKKCHCYSYLVRFLSSSSKSHFYLHSKGTLLSPSNLLSNLFLNLYNCVVHKLCFTQARSSSRDNSWQQLLAEQLCHSSCFHMQFEASITVHTNHDPTPISFSHPGDDANRHIQYLPSSQDYSAISVSFFS